MTQQTLQQLLVERVSIYAQSDRARELIDQGVESMFKDVVKDTFRSYGDFGKSVQEAIKAALPANVTDMFELQRYNALVANALRERWEAAALQSTVLNQAEKAIAEVMDGEGLLSGEVSLKELLDEFVSEHREKAAEEHWNNPEIRIEETMSGRSEFLYIGFDPEPEDSRALSSWRTEPRGIYSLKNSLHIRVVGSRKTDDPHRPTLQLAEVLSAKLDDKRIAVNMRIRSKWERMLASLYFGNAVLLIDCDADEFSYGFDD